MIAALSLTLPCPLGGNIAARAPALPVPGPMAGRGLMMALLSACGRLRAQVLPVAKGIRRHLALLCTPAGAGVAAHPDLPGAQALALGAAILASTRLALIAAAPAFVVVARPTGNVPDN